MFQSPNKFMRDLQKLKETHHKWYIKNKEKLMEKQKIKRHILKSELIKKLGGKCNKCGIDNIWTLTFHHKSDKKENINKYIRDSMSEEAFEEIKKCELLCFNCHESLHKKKRDNTKWIRRQERKLKYKKYIMNNLGGKCVVCGNSDIDCLTFHHKGEKKESMSWLIHTNSLEKIIEESKKCELMCFNCHMSSNAVIAQLGRASAL